MEPLAVSIGRSDFYRVRDLSSVFPVVQDVRIKTALHLAFAVLGLIALSIGVMIFLFYLILPGAF